jgi:hypothetical protein
MKRNRFDVRGHSGKEPVVVDKHATNVDGLPLQVELSQRSGLKVWSPRHGEYVADERAANLNLKFAMNIDTAMKFVAKVALSAGYFVYGELFRNNVKHSDFRAIMNFQPSNSGGHEGVEARIDDRFRETTSEDCQIFRTLCKASAPYSIVGFAHSSDRFGVFVGKAPNENSDAREDGIEEIEGTHRADADEVEERALHTQVSERLVQTLKDSVRATLLLLCFVWHISLVLCACEDGWEGAIRPRANSEHSLP